MSRWLDADTRSGYVARVLLLTAAYFGSAKIGLDLAFETSSVTAIWPPTGIALAALILGGPRLWPGVALGALLANVDTGVSAATVASITVGNTLEALTGRWLLVRVGRFDPSLRRVRDLLALLVLGAVASTMVSATIGVASLIGFESVTFDEAPSLWRTWWLGDLGGDLIVAPALLIAATHWGLDRPPGSLPEAILMALTTAGVSTFIFTTDIGLTYLLFPLLVWAALRFWQPGAAGASLIAGTIAVALTANGHGPYAMSDPDERLLLAQTFTGVAGISALLLAAVTTARHRAELAVQDIASTLEESLLPPRLPDLPDIETATLFRAAVERQRVGGDFYDVFQIDDECWGLSIGDVRGKGTVAAAMTALARYTLRAGTLRTQRPSEVLGLLNDAMLAEHGGEDFCTAVFATLAVGRPNPTVNVSIGGHPLPLLLRADGRVEEVGDPSVLIGLDPEGRFSDTEVELRSGDSIVFYTDGLTDAHAPEAVVSPAQLRRALASAARGSAAEVVATLEQELLGTAIRESRDDIAILVLKFGSETDVSSLTVGAPAARDAL